MHYVPFALFGIRAIPHSRPDTPSSWFTPLIHYHDTFCFWRSPIQIVGDEVFSSMEPLHGLDIGDHCDGCSVSQISQMTPQHGLVHFRQVGDIACEDRPDCWHTILSSLVARRSGNRDWDMYMRRWVGLPSMCSV